MKTLILCAALVGMAGCQKAEKPPTPKPELAHSPSHWIRYKYYEGSGFDLVCDESSKVIATYRNAMQSEHSRWEVFGGDGRSYGEFMNIPGAKAKAEWLVRQDWNKVIVSGSDLNKCP